MTNCGYLGLFRLFHFCGVAVYATLSLTKLNSHTSNAITHMAYCTSAPKLPLPHSHFICKPQNLSWRSYCLSDHQSLYQHWPLADGLSKQATPNINWILLPLWAPVPSQLFPPLHRPPTRSCKSMPARMAVVAVMWTSVLGELSPAAGWLLLRSSGCDTRE